jgi:hypothetical protein
MKRTQINTVFFRHGLTQIYTVFLIHFSVSSVFSCPPLGVPFGSKASLWRKPSLTGTGVAKNSRFDKLTIPSEVEGAARSLFNQEN